MSKNKELRFKDLSFLGKPYYYCHSENLTLCKKDLGVLFKGINKDKSIKVLISDKYFKGSLCFNRTNKSLVHLPSKKIISVYISILRYLKSLDIKLGEDFYIGVTAID